MKEIVYLLENKWIVRERDKEKYYQVKDSLKDYKDFLKEKLGYQLIVTPDFIKLEKIPGRAEAWMGIKEFNDKVDYALLCIILMFLEDKQKAEQFVLSQLTDYIQSNWPDKENPVDWTIYDFRKRFVKVLRYCCDNCLIVVDSGEQKDFIESDTVDVLYENTGLSSYMVNRLWCNVYEMNSYKDFENNEYFRFDDKGTIRKHRIYRNLLMSPVIYKFDGNGEDLVYIKNFREMVKKDIDKYLEADLHIHKNAALVILPNNRAYKDVFPNAKNISDIVLLMCSLIRYDYEDKMKLCPDGRLNISTSEFDGLVNKCIDKFSSGWGKSYREMPQAKVTEEIKNEMKSLRMISINDEDGVISILPLAGKVVGIYPKDYLKEETDNVKLENE